MTAAPGAALSHATLPRRRTLFSGVSGLQFFQSRLSESGVPTVGLHGLRSICQCMALMSRRRERRIAASYSSVALLGETSSPQTMTSFFSIS
jgi:hypothetical protein